MEAIHYQTPKGVLVLDSNGSLKLSIPVGSSTSGYNTTDGRVNILENKDSFNFQTSHGILVFRQNTTQNIISVSCHETDASEDKKLMRFTLEANSVVPTSLNPGKFMNVNDIVLFLSVANEVPQQKGYISSPQQNSLLNSLPSGLQNMVRQKSQNMSKGTDSRRILINQPSGNPEMDKRVSDITARMLNESESYTTEVMSSRPPPTARPTRTIAPSTTPSNYSSNNELNDSLASLKNSVKNGSNANVMSKLNNIMGNLNLKTQPSMPSAPLQIPHNLLEDSPAQQKANNLLKMLGSTLGKLKQ